MADTTTERSRQQAFKLYNSLMHLMHQIYDRMAARFALPLLIIMLSLADQATGASFDPLPEELSRVREFCEKLIENPKDRKSAKALVRFAKAYPEAKISPTLEGAYALTRLLAGSTRGFNNVENHLRKIHPDSPVLEQIAKKQFMKKCTTCSGKGVLERDCTRCSGSGKCQRCDGKGTIKRDSFEGSTKDRMCLVCKFDKKCRSCEGKRQFTRRCESCNGRRSIFFRTRAEAQLFKLLGQAKTLTGEEEQDPVASPRRGRRD
jgi:hypothetical protein